MLKLNSEPGPAQLGSGLLHMLDSLFGPGGQANGTGGGRLLLRRLRRSEPAWVVKLFANTFFFYLTRSAHP